MRDKRKESSTPLQSKVEERSKSAEVKWKIPIALIKAETIFDLHLQLRPQINPPFRQLMCMNFLRKAHTECAIFSTAELKQFCTLKFPNT
jgi:hypothetical protein